MNKRYIGKTTLLIGALLMTSILGLANVSALADTDPPSETSPPENIASNPARIGFPHPLESDNGWGGGSDKWDIVDGVRKEPAWDNGLAFTGGMLPYIAPCGWRQATINFGELKTFNRVIVWHPELFHVPNTYQIQYWDGMSWVDIFSTTSGHDYLKYPDDVGSPVWWGGFSIPLENTFEPVTSTKVRLRLNNCDLVHGWIYEFEVYYDEDDDVDDDGVLNEDDNCPNVANLDQADLDGDGQGDACDDDLDGDGWANDIDNCPTVANADQADLEGDGIGDSCDSDIDGDNVPNDVDNCPLDQNPGQDDTDFDSIGDACDDDDDGDGVLDTSDNCALVANSDQTDSDGDGQGDACDGDLDGDGWANDIDNCPTFANSGQSDFDEDGVGDACDSDIDGDGISKGSDDCGFTPLGEVVNTVGCSIDQLCPCEGPRGTTASWKNHGKYVSCVAQNSAKLVEQGVITEEEKDMIVSDAAESSCGHKNQ